MSNNLLEEIKIEIQQQQEEKQEEKEQELQEEQKEEEEEEVINKLLKQKNKDINCLNLIWQYCSSCYERARNGDRSAIDQLERLAQYKINENENDADVDIICLGYFVLIFIRSSEFKDTEKLSKFTSLLSEKLSQLFTINPNYSSTITNKYEQFIYGMFFEEGIGVEKNLDESFRLRKLSADQDYVLAICSVGYYYNRGFGCTVNPSLAISYYQKAADKGFSVAQYNLGLQYQKGDGVIKDLKIAFYWFELSALQGYISSQYKLGTCYEKGFGVEKQPTLAFEWYKKTADRGDSDGQYAIGWCYIYGKGVERNVEEGLKWYKKSADQGFTKAQYYLAEHYISSNDILRQNEGYELKRKLAEENYPKAQYSVGLQYFVGDRVIMNEEEAIKWFKLSSDGGYWKASQMLSRFYYYGRLLNQDKNEALRLLDQHYNEGSPGLKYLFGLSCIQDKDQPSNQKRGYESFVHLNSKHDVAYYDVKYMLGLCYEYGIGVERNESKAFSFYSQSNHHNYPPAQYSLARCYEEGLNNRLNLTESKRLYELSFNQGNIDSKLKSQEFEEDNTKRIKMSSKTMKYEFI